MQGLSIPLHEAERGSGFPGPLFSCPDGPKTFSGKSASDPSNPEMGTAPPARVNQPAPDNGRRPGRYGTWTDREPRGGSGMGNLERGGDTPKGSCLLEDAHQQGHHP